MEMFDRALLELDKVKEHATQIEWDKLIRGLNVLNGNLSEVCIYGLMTGICWSPRALELVQLCSTSPWYSVRGVGMTYKEELIVLEEEDKNRDAHMYRRNISALELALIKHEDAIKQRIKELNGDYK